MTDGGVATEPVRIPGVVVDEFRHDPVGSTMDEPAPPSSPVPPATPAVEAAGGVPAVDPAPAKEKKAATVRGAGMASGGQPVEMPGAAPAGPVWPDPRNADEVYVPEEFDATDLAEVNRELNRARARLFRVSQELKRMQRFLAEAQCEYDRQMRRELVSISGGTAETRKAMAEIRCESLENRVIVGKQVVEEWKKRSVDCRDDLKAVENIAHNVRAQMDVR